MCAHHHDHGRRGLRLGTGVRQCQLGAADRIGLLSDTSALVTAGAAEPTQLLTLLAAYGEAEQDATVWGMVLERLSALCSLSGYSSSSAASGNGNGNDAPPAALAVAMRGWGRGIVLQKLAQVGWSPCNADGHLTRKLRGELIGLLPAVCAGAGADPAVAAALAECRGRFETFAANPADAVSKVCPPCLPAYPPTSAVL